MKKTEKLSYNGEVFEVVIKTSKKNKDNVSYGINTEDRNLTMEIVFPVDVSTIEINNWLERYTETLYNHRKDSLFRLGIEKYTYEQGEEHPYLGDMYALNIIEKDEPGHYKIELNKENKTMDITLSKQFSNNKDVIIKLLKHWYYKEAYNYLKEMSDKYRKQMDFIPEGDLIIKIVDSKKFFGRCWSQKNIVEYCYSMIKYKPSYLEYLVVHELCHFKEPNHEPAFWRLVQVYYPGWRKMDKRLDVEARINLRGV